MKLEEYEKERDAEREQEEAQARQEIEECDLDKAFTPLRTGVGQTGFGRNHPVEQTRRRLYVKTLLRQARAHELLGDAQAATEQLQAVLRAEPQNPEAKTRLSIFAHPPAPLAASAVSLETTAASDAAGYPVPSVPTSVHNATSSTLQAGSTSNGESKGEAKTKQERKKQQCDTGDDADEDEQTGPDHAAISTLLKSAAEYMRKNDYTSALQIYGYARRQCKDWESPMVELKVLSNTCLCLQRLRGRMPELVSACNEVMDRIDTLREAGNLDAEIEEMLIHMESACLSRRGHALAQLKRTEESARDAARVRDLLARSGAKSGA